MTALVLIIFIATSYKKMFRQEQVYPSKVITVWVPETSAGLIMILKHIL